MQKLYGVFVINIGPRSCLTMLGRARLELLGASSSSQLHCGTLALSSGIHVSLWCLLDWISISKCQR